MDEFNYVDSKVRSDVRYFRKCFNEEILARTIRVQNFADIEAKGG